MNVSLAAVCCIRHCSSSINFLAASFDPWRAYPGRVFLTGRSKGGASGSTGLDLPDWSEVGADFALRANGSAGTRKGEGTILPEAGAVLAVTGVATEGPSAGFGGWASSAATGSSALNLTFLVGLAVLLPPGSACADDEDEEVMFVFGVFDPNEKAR